MISKSNNSAAGKTPVKLNYAGMLFGHLKETSEEHVWGGGI